MTLSLVKRIALGMAVSLLLGLLLGFWLALPLSVLIGAAILAWPKGVRLGSLTLLRQIEPMEFMCIGLLEWRWHLPYEDGRPSWQLCWMQSIRGWHLPLFSRSTIDGIVYVALDLPILGTLAFEHHPGKTVAL